MVQPANFGVPRNPAETEPLVLTEEAWAVRADDSLEALATLHSGAARPGYAFTGMLWLDNSGTPWILNMFDGTNDVALARINAAQSKAQVLFHKGADIPSAGALTLGSDGNVFTVTGTAAITSINSVRVGTIVSLRFAASLTLTNGPALQLPDNGNIVTQAGDTGIFQEVSAGDWECLSFSHNTAKPINAATQTALNTKLASSVYTAADVIAKLLTVDGSGSGLDADKLKGVDGGSFVQTSRTIATGTGLSGGGNLSANRTLALNVNGLAVDGAPNKSADYLLSYDVSAGIEKRVLMDIVAGGGFTEHSSSPINTTSGTSFLFGSIPGGVSHIRLVGREISTNSNDSHIIRLGDAGGIETTGYTYAIFDPAAQIDYTNGFQLLSGSSSRLVTFIMDLVHVGGNVWVATVVFNIEGNNPYAGAGRKTLTGELTQIQLVRSGGGTYDAGALALFYQ